MLYIDHPDSQFKTHCIGTKLTFILIPKRCHLTGKYLWLTMAYEQTAMWTGPGEPTFEYRYYDRNEFLTEKIKGNV